MIPLNHNKMLLLAVQGEFPVEELLVLVNSSISCVNLGLQNSTDRDTLPLQIDTQRNLYKTDIICA